MQASNRERQKEGKNNTSSHYSIDHHGRESNNMALSDRLLGGSLLAVATFVFSYYTVWALITPLFPSDSFIQSYFPPRVWAIRLPAIVLVLGLGVVGSFVGLVMQKEAAKKKAKEARKGA